RIGIAQILGIKALDEAGIGAEQERGRLQYGVGRGFFRGLGFSSHFSSLMGVTTGFGWPSTRRRPLSSLKVNNAPKTERTPTPIPLKYHHGQFRKREAVPPA